MPSLVLSVYVKGLSVEANWTLYMIMFLDRLMLAYLTYKMLLAVRFDDLYFATLMTGAFKSILG